MKALSILVTTFALFSFACGGEEGAEPEDPTPQAIAGVSCSGTSYGFAWDYSFDGTDGYASTANTAAGQVWANGAWSGRTDGIITYSSADATWRFAREGTALFITYARGATETAIRASCP